MPYIAGHRVGKLKLIMIEENLRIKDLHYEIVRQCAILKIKPVTQAELSKFSYGDRPDRLGSTYLKIVNALNSLTNRERPYDILDIIEPDEILKPKIKVR